LPTAPQRPRPGRAVWVITAAAAVLAIAAVTMSVIDATKSPPAPTTTTVTAAPPSYTAEQVAAAKAESCAASINASRAITAASTAYVATLPNRDSPESKAVLANEQNVIMVELGYLELHTPPATPPEVAKPTRDFINATLDVIDADTRGQDRAAAAVRTGSAIDALNEACK